MAIENLNEFLHGRCILRAGKVFGSILHFDLEGGSIEVMGADWSLVVDGVKIESSEEIEASQNLQVLVGRTILGVTILRAGACALAMEGATLNLTDASRPDYLIGAEMLEIFRYGPEGADGPKEFITLHALLSSEDCVWKDAHSPI